MKSRLFRFINRKKLVKVRYFTASRREVTHYLIPTGLNNNEITIQGKRWVLNENAYYMDNKFYPTYIVSDRDAEPHDPYRAKDKPYMTPSQYDTAISAQVAYEVFKNWNKPKPSLQAFVSIITIVVVVAGLGFMYMELQTLMAILSEIKESLASLGV